MFETPGVPFGLAFPASSPVCPVRGLGSFSWAMPASFGRHRSPGPHCGSRALRPEGLCSHGHKASVALRPACAQLLIREGTLLRGECALPDGPGVQPPRSREKFLRLQERGSPGMLRREGEARWGDTHRGCPAGHGAAGAVGCHGGHSFSFGLPSVGGKQFDASSHHRHSLCPQETQQPRLTVPDTLVTLSPLLRPELLRGWAPDLLNLWGGARSLCLNKPRPPR